MRYIEKTGRTLEEAIQGALTELGIEKSKAKIEVLEEGSKGLLGIFSGKEFKVRVSSKNQAPDRAINFLNKIFNAMKFDVDIDYTETSEGIEIELNSEKNGILIGRRGETLDALQYLTSIVVNKGDQEYNRIILDSEQYRQKRKETLKKLANRLAAKVARDRKNVTLEPMTAYERRIIHSTLQNNKYVETSSIGESPNRRLVISYKG